MMNVYERMGLPGCIGSTDCVHLKWDRCPVGISNVCSGKEGYPTLAYSVTVDHSRKIHASTTSFYGAKNDKSIVRFDKHITDVRDKVVYEDVQYHIYNAAGALMALTGQTWFLCDGGYHKWANMINPMKHPSVRSDRLWSEWMESTRKDVECCFGILKQRFRFLRNGIVLQSQDLIDNVFFTCCIFHNMLLEFDGLDTRWNLTEAEWERLDPQPTSSDANYDENGDVIEIIASRSSRAHILERRSVLRTDEEEAILDNDIEEEIDNTYEAKRRALIVHFHTAYNKGEVAWPRGMSEEDKQRAV